MFDMIDIVIIGVIAGVAVISMVARYAKYKLNSTEHKQKAFKKLIKKRSVERWPKLFNGSFPCGEHIVFFGDLPNVYYDDDMAGEPVSAVETIKNLAYRRNFKTSVICSYRKSNENILVDFVPVSKVYPDVCIVCQGGECCVSVKEGCKPLITEEERQKFL